jgi:serine/threonine protein kinase
MSDDYDGWEIIKNLGEGGQGKVYLALNPYTVRNREDSIVRMLRAARAFSGDSDKIHPKEFEDAITKFIDVKNSASHGALKILSIKPGKDENEAQGRFQKEVAILNNSNNPALLQLLHANLAKRFMVTEYHPEILRNKSGDYKGNVLASLTALRPIVNAVAELHSQGIIHRDIKTDNIFVASGGRLVLGDFGIVFYRDSDAQRFTDTYEKVGSRDWMPPWCHTGKRLEDVKPNFDVFPLGKVLWAMISGQAFLPYWYHRKEGYNLEQYFPNEPGMRNVNAILDKCITENETDCLPSAKELLSVIDAELDRLKHNIQQLQEDVPWPCHVCGIGKYQQLPGDRFVFARYSGEVPSYSTILTDERTAFITARVFACDNCGNIEYFRFPDGKKPNGWLPSKR